MSSDEDDLLAQLESELPDIDCFTDCVLCEDIKDLILKTSQGEACLGLISSMEMSDKECDLFIKALSKSASKIEALNLDSLMISPSALTKLLDFLFSNIPNLKALDLSSISLTEAMVKLICPFIESSTKCKQLVLVNCNINTLQVKKLCQALEKNKFILDFQLSLDTLPQELALKIEDILVANRNRPPPTQHPSPNQGGGGGGVSEMSVWVKGLVHFGIEPPSSDYVKLTFDAAFVASHGGGGHSTSSKPMEVKAVPLSAPSATKPSSTVVAKATTVSPVKPSTVTTTAAAATTKSPAASSVAPNKPVHLFMVEALFAYEAEDADELSFVQGDKIAVLKVVDEDWYVGRLDRTQAKGQVPTNYTKPI